ncbi:hypothetical protein OG243_11990 [Streptomyces sp. NBC_01318]|uniref:hypothetical protein n=1 Tax=Streptomyces sp. NBC_01318 TaxID=2903823 RepID=UPI002E104EA4|nr:hypothetical protein OG243_11990 [Streptomyces sp. NBC_01318]
MDWKAIATVAVGVIGLIGVMAQRRYNRAQGRDRAKADLDRLALLPEDSSVREELRITLTRPSAISLVSKTPYADRG